jgi:hypothetical protein
LPEAVDEGTNIGDMLDNGERYAIRREINSCEGQVRSNLTQVPQNLPDRIHRPIPTPLEELPQLYRK